MNNMPMVGFIAGLLLLLAVGSWLATRAEGPSSTSRVVAQSGLHWHATLALTADGQPVSIPANLGLGAVHNPIHTHDDEPGLIHMEFGGRVTEDDLRLANFFRLLGREIPDTATMTVNGERNSEFGRYMMRDGDAIEISY